MFMDVPYPAKRTFKCCGPTHEQQNIIGTTGTWGSEKGSSFASKAMTRKCWKLLTWTEHDGSRWCRSSSQFKRLRNTSFRLFWLHGCDCLSDEAMVFWYGCSAQWIDRDSVQLTASLAGILIHQFPEFWRVGNMPWPCAALSQNLTKRGGMALGQ